VMGSVSFTYGSYYKRYYTDRGAPSTSRCRGQQVWLQKKMYWLSKTMQPDTVWATVLYAISACSFTFGQLLAKASPTPWYLMILFNLMGIILSVSTLRWTLMMTPIPGTN